MRNLLIFITKYSAFFLFLIFEAIALYIFINYNNFQKASFINTANEVTGNMYRRVNNINDYLSLKEINDSLAKENARLRNQLKSSQYVDTTGKGSVVDTIYKQQYSYIEARVINNSVNHRMNYITLNKGSHDGIAKDMGVVSDAGVVGIVVQTSQHFSIVRSLLHKDTRISAMLAASKEGGSFMWAEDMDPRKGLLYDVANDAQPRLGDLVVTDQHSLFPIGIPLGKVSNLKPKTGGFFLNMEVRLAVDFSKLEYVYVISNKLATEQTGLEALQKTEDE
ncbi:rod shape-determining protein MreC [Mucilaginibacter limnophilus]|uniref:Cell shape-determining protein MreC n=1 Tax=Mucilaginibacter limnophilus TaxID=1932778 RepID=A0A437MR96_9SPHI|nr:rod shape-determining protein MreC [Mucilaginibacter limnophilus]RVU00162.1 rod shape-determining protein MreC [Mucilaginibacter limnophilus]